MSLKSNKSHSKLEEESNITITQTHTHIFRERNKHGKRERETNRLGLIYTSDKSSLTLQSSAILNLNFGGK